MSNKNLGIILLSSVLTFGIAPFAFSQSSQQKTQQPATGSQRQPDATSGKMQKDTTAQDDMKSGKMEKGATATQDEVKKAQQALKDQGMYNGAVDGTMNADFQKALRDYQTQNKLSATGKLDRQTMAKLGIMKKATGTGGSDTGTGKATTSKKGQKQSSQFQSDDQVRQVQTALQQKGIDPGPIDGIMGPKTKKAIADFQRQQNLSASGNLDQQTMAALGVGGMKGNTGVTGEEQRRQKPSDLTPNPNLNPTPTKPELPAQPEQPKPDPYQKQPDPNRTPGTLTPDIGSDSTPNPNMGTASSVEDIRQAQMALKNRGFDPGEINGMLSSDTQEAIRKFQSANNLPVTGNLDDRTQAALGVQLKGTKKPDAFNDQSLNSTPDNDNTGLGGTEHAASVEQTQRTTSSTTIEQSTTEHKKHDTVAKAERNKPGKIEHEYYARAEKAAAVLQSLTNASDNRIPDKLLRRAEAIAVIPNMIKGAFGIGGRYGKGMVAKRLDNGRWGAPAFISIGGGSFGAQLGVNETDLVLVFTDKAGVDSLEKGMSLKLGVDAGVTAGPIGREGEAGVSENLKSGIFAYSRSKGLFAGIALDGAVLDMDKDANRKVYGENAEAHAIMSNATMATNANVRPFLEALERVTPAKKTTEK